MRTTAGLALVAVLFAGGCTSQADPVAARGAARASTPGKPKATARKATPKPAVTKPAATKPAAPKPVATKPAAPKPVAKPATGRTQAPRPAPAVRGTRTDPRYDTCKEAKSHGFGPYRQGVDPEYDWYFDRDSDGIVCE